MRNWDEWLLIAETDADGKEKGERRVTSRKSSVLYRQDLRRKKERGTEALRSLILINFFNRWNASQ